MWYHTRHLQCRVLGTSDGCDLRCKRTSGRVRGACTSDCTWCQHKQLLLLNSGSLRTPWLPPPLERAWTSLVFQTRNVHRCREGLCTGGRWSSPLLGRGRCTVVNQFQVIVQEIPEDQVAPRVQVQIVETIKATLQQRVDQSSVEHLWTYPSFRSSSKSSNCLSDHTDERRGITSA